MLSERDMQELSVLASKLSVEGYNVADIRSILATERTKINQAAAKDLQNYFPITNNVGVRIAGITYGFNKLTLNITTTLERQSGVFDMNSKPYLFEGILRNAVFNCLKDIKTAYLAEVDELNPIPAPSSIKTASATNPLVFTVGSNVLYAESGSIDTAIAWTVGDIKDGAGNSINNNGNTTTATSSASLLLDVTDGTNTTTFTITSGTYDGTDIKTNNVAVSGGI